MPVTRRAKAVEAVQNLTFSVAPGEVFGLLGANGAGKSTSISMIVRAVEPHSGHATVSGKSVPVWKSTGASTNFAAMTRPCWLGRAARNRIATPWSRQRRWRGGRRDDSAERAVKF